MSTNLYGASCTPNLGGVSDFYTKAEVNKLLGAKAGTSTTYTRTYLDSALSTLTSAVTGLDVNKVSTDDLDTALIGLESDILTEVASLYALKTETYTITEIDTLLSGLSIDPGDFIRLAPTTTAENTVFPGTVNAVPLTLRGSSTNPIIQEWLSNAGDRIGIVSNDGSVGYERTVDIGRLVSTGGIGLTLNARRISEVGVPLLGSDAVPLSYMQSYIIDTFEDVLRGDQEIYNLDAGVY
jgi:hypothetical protein